MLLEAGTEHRARETPCELHALGPLAMLDRERFAHFQWLELEARQTDAQPPVQLPRGGGLGGTSLINARIALRAPLEDFDASAEAAGPRWRPEAVLQSFVALEDDEQFGDESYHGRGGPLLTSHQNEDGWSSVDAALAVAACDAGAPFFADVNEPRSTGVSPLAYSGRDGALCSTNEAYLEPARVRANLEIVGSVLVDLPRANTNLTAIMIGEHVAATMRNRDVAAAAPKTSSVR